MTLKSIMFLCVITISSSNSNLNVLLRTRTSFLERYQGYSNVVVIHFKVPQDTLFAAFKFTADETQMSIFRCATRNVSLYMKHGSPPVINPDESEFPKLFRNITTSKLYNYEFLTDKNEVYINISSPEPGSYYAATFLSYTDPRQNAITQQGLSPSCFASLEAILYAEKIQTPIIVSENDLIEVAPSTNENRYLKFFVPSLFDRGIMLIEEILFVDGVDSLIVRIQPNRPPSEHVFQKTEVFYPNITASSILFFVKPEMWHYIQIKFQNKTSQVTSDQISKLRFKLRYLSNVVIEDSRAYDLLVNETQCSNSTIKTFYDNRITDVIPYVEYDLLRESSTDSFVFSFELTKEMDSNVAIPINMTDKHFSVLKFDVREISDMGGTLQFVVAFKPRVTRNSRSSRFLLENEPEGHTIVACLQRASIEIPTWPNSCILNGVQKPAQLTLNNTVQNASILIPFPESGTWYATFKLFCGKCEPCNCSEDCQRIYEECLYTCGSDCLNDTCNSCMEDCRESTIELEDCGGCNCDGACLRNKSASCNSSIIFDISSKPCVMGQCSENGKCMFMVSDGVLFSTCVCSNRYRGWTCSDGSLATPYAMVVLELLLLVLSNLMFLPAVCIAFRRKYYIEAITYFAICFFSTFYHACDAGENLISYCLVRLAALQFGDFFCALLAIWVTLIAIADLLPLITSICHMTGAIILAFCTNIDRTALWIFVVPAVSGVLIVGVSWYLKYRKIKQRFVNKKYVYFNIPIGALLVTIGLVLYAFLQTESNYKYLHSLWHMIMAVSIIIVLPKRNTFLPDVLI